MPSISIPAAITAVAGIGQAIIGGSAASKAASTQAQAATGASQLQMKQFQATQAALSPFISAGAGALPMLSGLLGTTSMTPPGMAGGAGGQTEAQILAQVKQGLVDWHNAVPSGGAQGIIEMIDKGAPLAQVQMALNAASGSTTHPKNVAWLNQIQQSAGQMPSAAPGPGGGALGATGPGGAKPFSPQQFLEQTPGYQFALSQGLKSTQAGYSARGLGGAALKGAAEYSTGLADQTYGNQIQRYMDMAKLGATSAGQMGQIGAGQVGQIGESMVGGANALASGQVGVAKNIGNALGAVGTGASQYYQLTGMQEAGLGPFAQQNTGMFGGTINSLSPYGRQAAGAGQGFAPGSGWSPYGYAY